jgi:hypothetical protein
MAKNKSTGDRQVIRLAIPGEAVYNPVVEHPAMNSQSFVGVSS